VLALGLAAAGCSGPVRAVRVDRSLAYRDVARSAILSGEPSWASRDVLLERGLFEAFDDDPAGGLAALHRQLVAEGGSPDVLFALAELSYLYGERARRPEHSLAAVVYAYAFLFPEGRGERPGPFDPRVRTAADLYNWALTAAFASPDRTSVLPRGGTFALPFGAMTVAFDPAMLRVGQRELYGFVPVAELEVRGLAMRYRWPGLGAPLAASTRIVEGAAADADLVAPRLRVPVTAVLHVAHAREALVDGTPLGAVLELHPAWERDAIAVGDDVVPLENEPTAALALTFTGVPVTEVELFGFLGRLSTALEKRPPLVSATPYRPGLVPVVFVHGTASSIVRWAEMYNRLYADPELRRRCQFWFFQYDSGNPIALSALQLREALTAALARLDPAGADPALRRMVLIGHSQGGLLVKMQAVRTEHRLWDAVSRQPLEALRVSDSSRDLLRRALFLEPLPAVGRVVFIATPHRGSFVAGRQWIAHLVRRLARLPFALGGLAAEIARDPGVWRSPIVPTAVDNMSPHQPFIRGLQTIPVDPTIPAHSIIAVDTGGPLETGNDGVVAYTSAHIDGVESELVVRSPHSCQANPHAMEEVRRILRLHVGLPVSGAEAGQGRGAEREEQRGGAPAQGTQR